MSKTNVLPSRTQAKIPTSLCRECFCAVPQDRLQQHHEWHITKRKVSS